MDDNLEHKWYVVHTHSNYEHKAKKSLEERIKAYNVEDHFSGILVPSEQIKKATQGKKKAAFKKTTATGRTRQGHVCSLRHKLSYRRTHSRSDGVSWITRSAARR